VKRGLLLITLVALLAIIARQGAGESRAHAASAAQTRSQAAALQPGPVPLYKQAYRNNCETAALSMLLGSAGVRVDQRKLQRELPRSGPLDPIVAADGTWTWGAPDEGFVGRVEGGGSAGGFGVYQGPIRRLAARYNIHLTDLSRTNINTIVGRLRQGRPVMSWIGLSEGPYRRWRTPGGRSISVNFGEHAVVLTGISSGMILVNDPLSGTRLRWTVDEYAAKWKLLGQRALGL
jgi:uncharacterized protein YvpB